MSEFKDIERLLRLKRYEQPPEGYYEDFIQRFKERQRSEMLRLSARGLLLERVSTWLHGVPARHWMYAGGTASAMLAVGIYLMPGQAENGESESTVPASEERPTDTAGASETGKTPPRN